MSAFFSYSSGLSEEPVGGGLPSMRQIISGIRKENGSLSWGGALLNALTDKTEQCFSREIHLKRQTFCTYEVYAVDPG